MKKHFKKHILNMKRYQTSLGRDLEKGLRLDRNEKVSNFPEKIMSDILRQFKPYSLSASPESEGLYKDIAKSLGIRKDKIYVTSGITEGMRILFETLTNPGENVIVLDPTYPMYPIYAKLYDVEYRKFTYATNLLPNISSLYANMDKKTSMVMIPNPNLPVESVFSKKAIENILVKCKKNGTIVVIDEAYHYFGGPSVINLVDKHKNLVVMRTFSKAYGLAAIRLGFIVSSAENIRYLSKTRSIVESNTLSMKAASYMLRHPSIMRAHAREVKKGARYIHKKLNEIGIKWHGGNFTNGILLFLKNRKDADSLVSFLKRKKIYIRSAFQKPLDACVRVSIGPENTMKQFVKALKEWKKRERIK